jgi:hypothetical protein
LRQQPVAAFVAGEAEIAAKLGVGRRHRRDGGLLGRGQRHDIVVEAVDQHAPV